VAYGEMTAEGRAAFDAWLAADRRNRGAYLRARAGLHAMEDAVRQGRPALAPDNDNSLRSRVASAARRPRGVRRLLAGGAMAAGLAAVAVVGASHHPLARPPAVAADQIMKLKDGSIATLRPGARIEVAVSDKTRRVTLLSGEATFTVAKDQARPFVVRSGDVYAQATGTVYSVSRLGATGGAISVSEGSVLVWARDERDQAVLLHAGGKLTLDPGPLAPAATQDAPPPLRPPALAQISLDDVELSSAVARFNRINRTQIVIDDPEIGRTRIVGLFKAHDPEQFAQAAAAIADARVAHRNGFIVIEKQ